MAEKSKMMTALGLENIQSLKKTVEEVTELQKSLNESKEALTKLLEANNPISRSIAQSIDAQTLKSLKEGDLTALEELKAKVAEELKEAKEVNTALTQENKQLKDALQTQTTRQIIAEELDRRLPKGSNPGGDDNLTTAINNLVAERLNALVGGGQQGNLTAEDIRKIIGEEVKKATEGNNSPDQVTDNIVKMLTVSDTVKQKLGISEGGSRYLPQAGNLRSDVLRLLLEDERERLKISQEYEAQMERNKHLGVLAGAVKENIEDFVGATRDMVKEHRESRSETGESREGSKGGGFAVRCSLCNKASVLPEKPTGIFECPECHGKLELEEPGAERKPLPEHKPLQTPPVASSLEI